MKDTVWWVMCNKWVVSTIGSILQCLSTNLSYFVSNVCNYNTYTCSVNITYFAANMNALITWPNKKYRVHKCMGSEKQSKKLTCKQQHIPRSLFIFGPILKHPSFIIFWKMNIIQHLVPCSVEEYNIAVDYNNILKKFIIIFTVSQPILQMKIEM